MSLPTLRPKPKPMTMPHLQLFVRPLPASGPRNCDAGVGWAVETGTVPVYLAPHR